MNAHRTENVRVLRRRRVFDDIFAIDEATIEHRRHDGSWSEPIRQLSFERGDSVAALLARRDTGHLVLVDQFRYPTLEEGNGWLTEIVAGGLEKGESPESAILREIEEETGFVVDSLEHVATFFVSPGGSSERVFLYYAEVSREAGRGSSQGRGVGDEDIRVVELTPSELWRKTISGELPDAKTLIATQWYRTHRWPEPEAA